MTGSEVDEKLRKFDHLEYINDFSFQEKLEYFSLLVERYRAYLTEKPDHAEVWRRAIRRQQRKVDRYNKIVGAVKI